MSDNIKTIIKDGVAEIIVGDPFVFNSHPDFRKETKSVLENSGVREIEVNFRNVKYIDSAALGMLLLLKENAELSGKRIYLTQVRGFVLDVFNTTNFHLIFKFR